MAFLLGPEMDVNVYRGLTPSLARHMIRHIPFEPVNQLRALNALSVVN